MIRLLAEVASKGGNLMMNIGPMGNGKLPEMSEKYFRATGAWLKRNGEAIYGTGYGPIPPQPWGVTTAKPGRLYLHVFERPANGRLLIPGFTAKAQRAGILGQPGNQALKVTQQGRDVVVQLPAVLPDERNTVVVLNYSGALEEQAALPATVDPNFEKIVLTAQEAKTSGNAKTNRFTHRYYFGDWKHAICLVGQQAPEDEISYQLRFTAPGDYKISLEYSADSSHEGREGMLFLTPQGGRQQHYPFQVLLSGKFDHNKPLLFLDQAVAVVNVKTPGEWTLTVRPLKSGGELFRLRQINVEPVK
jgi:alpha-L-fucosidase